MCYCFIQILIENMRMNAVDMNEKLNQEIEVLTEKYEKMIDEYEEAKIGELNQLRDDLKLKVKEAAKSQADSTKYK